MKPTPTDLPDDWSRCSLGELLREVDVRVIDLPLVERKSIEVLSLTKRFGLIPQSERFKKRVATNNIDNYKVVRRGWIVYNPYVIWEGAIHSLRRNQPGIVSPVYPVWERTENDGGFLDLILRTPELIAAYEKFSAGAVNRRRSIQKDNFLSIQVARPPLAEQREIANVLGVVQQAIDHERHLLDVTTELKQALLQHFFTRGFHRDVEAQTDNRSLPQSSQFVRLEDVCSFLSGGTPSKSRPEFWVGPIPWVSPKDMKRPRLSVVTDHISRAGLEAGSSLAPAGAVFVVVRGMILARDIPVALAEVPMAFNQDIKAIIPGPRILPTFLLYALTAFKRNLFEKVGRSAHGTMTLMSNEIAQFTIPLPDKRTQRTIATAVETIERKHEQHQCRHAALTELFRTLLHQLITAKIRVNDLNLHSLEEPT